MKHALAAAGIVLGLITPVAADPTPEPAAPPPAEAAPAQGAPEPQGDPRIERQRTGAAKLAGMIRFVGVSCPEAKPDYDRFKKVIAAMNVDIKDLETGPLMATSLGYSRAYEKDAAESCKRAFEHFGESGTTIPGLIAHKTP